MSALQQLRRAGAEGAVDHSRERHRLAELKAPSEKGFRFYAVTRGADVDAELVGMRAGSMGEILPHLAGTFHDADRQNQVPSEQAEPVDVDRRAVAVGRIHAEVVIGSSQEGFAGPLRADQQRIAQCHPEIVGVGIPAAAVGDQRSELRILVVLAGPVEPREKGMSIPHRVVKAPQELLAFLPEREHPAVPFEQGDDVGIVARRQRRRKLPHQRRRDQPRSTEARPQGLLRGRQLVQKGVVLKQGDEDGFVAVETFVSAVEKGPLPSERSADRRPALRSRIGGLFRIEEVPVLEVAVAKQSEQASMQLGWYRPW